MEPDLRKKQDLIEQWPSSRQYIRCTGLPHVKDKADSLSVVVLRFIRIFFVRVLFPFS